jgi:hypothetical protein
VSKRHQSNRRKSYGRRQHEVTERRQHDAGTDRVELGRDDIVPASITERLGFLDPRTLRLGFALGD